ncbi:MAG: hypothetical protein IPJ78_13510 [Gemmatimonadetes bacterium]|nr:hypothetical protein [Gemmatimonadota bacterium]
MITLRDKDRGTAIGTISEGDVALLRHALEEESREDRDYYLTADTIDLLEAKGGTVEFITLLRSALGAKEGIEVEWGRS